MNCSRLESPEQGRLKKNLSNFLIISPRRLVTLQPLMDGRARVWAQRATRCLDTNSTCGYTVKTQWIVFGSGLGQHTYADHHKAPF